MMIPLAAAVTAAHADPVAASTNECDRPLYIWPSQKIWHGESRWVTVLPWKLMESCSFEKPQRRSPWKRAGMCSAPGMSAARGHVTVDRSISPGAATSHAHGPRRRPPSVVGDVVQRAELVVVAPPPPVRQRAEVPEHVVLCGHRAPCRHPSIDSSGHAVRGTKAR